MSNHSTQTLHRAERGVTALETAIILIAFVVAATMFAFTILSSGTFLTERSKEAAHSSLSQVQGSMELKGGVILTASTLGANGVISEAHLIVANVAGGQPIDFIPASGQRVVQIEYRDERQRQSIDTWSFVALGYDDGDNLLEERELFEIVVPLTSLSLPLGPNTKFSLEVKPPIGAPLLVQRLTPPNIDNVMDLK